MARFVGKNMRKKSFCGDILNLLSREDQNYHWSRSFWYYAKIMDRENNKVWTPRIVLVGCVPKVFECEDIATWCVDKLI
jgi:hypothetical protein